MANTRISVICDLLYTLSVREKCSYKTSKFGWRKRKASLICSLTAMKTLCQYTEKTELTDTDCEEIITAITPFCPKLLKEPEFRGDFAGTLRTRWANATPTAELTTDEKKMLALASEIVSVSLRLMMGRHADEEKIKLAVWNYLHGLHNVIRTGLPADDRFRVSPETGWEFAKSYLEPRFSFVPEPKPQASGESPNDADSKETK